MRSDRRRWIFLGSALMACNNGTDDDTSPLVIEHFPETAVVRSDVIPPPVSGGTLISIENGDAAVASDPDRDLLHVVDLADYARRFTVELPAGDEPGRLVADDQGRVHVVARRGGAIVTLDPETGTLLDRRPVCSNPRGIAYESELDTLHVACAGGDLVSLAATGGEPSRRVHVTPDLRDVLVTRDGLVVTTFRSAHVITLDDAGAIVERQGLPTSTRFLSDGVFGSIDDPMAPNTAWRTILSPAGRWVMLHQASTERPLTLPEVGPDGRPEPPEPGDDGAGYGSSDFEPCGGVVHPSVSMGTGVFSSKTSPLLENTVLPVDIAISPDGDWMALAVAGQRKDNPDHVPSGLKWLPTSHLSTAEAPGCEDPSSVPVTPGQYTAVTFDPQGRLLAQSRSPAQLVRYDPNHPSARMTIELSGPERRDTGHDLFHLDAGAGISCASCHPEGGDDGQVWNFVDFGPRHTPALSVGLEGTAPFHWEGDLSDMRHLADDVHTIRMGGLPLSDEWVGALESYMYALPIPNPSRDREDAAVARGQALFARWGCGTCHQGEGLTSNENVPMGYAYTLQVPGLRGVALHPPFMHDGRASSLRSAVEDMLLHTRPDAASPPAGEMDDMVAYLESL